ncbi:hypothetical protein H6A32_07020 [Drancourtella massiliensis]|uniref:DUF6128 domain-containing protein n=1 Tax=Drancourtella massiliensis TaxID=1632013 RepID=A0ABS2EGR6_9FIRM|nr:DUF6128 domain-containing protein [Drancourtella massiliensis]MBM6744061.1 hypothetical protein [Drancourtella massiliensis]
MERKRKQAGSRFMKRFICYLYEYQEGRRIRNIGFCKVESSEDGCTVSIHGKGWGMNSPRKLSLYLFWRENGKCLGVYQGELGNVSPALNYRLSYTEEDVGSKARYDRVEGIILCGENGPRYAAVWTDEAVDISRMEPAEKEEMTEEKEEQPEEPEEPNEEEPVPEENEMPDEQEEPAGVSYDVREILPEESRELEEKEPEPFYFDEEEEDSKPEIAEQECQTTCRFRCTKIQRQDLSRLIRREWQLANNSFLLHGYYNYHHLAFLQEGENLYLGVPGVYSEKERRAAQAFGFPGFVNYEEEMLDLPEGEKEDRADFGYWCRQVHQIRV